MASPTPLSASADAVAIVGAGPVGLALANELSWRGIPHLLIEKRTEPLDFPTAESVHTRTMEIIRRWGIADDVRFSGFPPDLPRSVSFVTTLSGYSLGRVERPSNREQQRLSSSISPEGALWCPKFLFDHILLERARSSGYTTFLEGYELMECRQGDTLDLTLRQALTGKEELRRVRFLCVCEGASSPTRKRLGINMEGTFSEGRNLGIYFRSAQLADIMSRHRGVMADIVNPRFSANLTSVDGSHLWRLIFFQRDRDPALLEPATCIADAVGHPIEATILDARLWAGHSAVASRFRDGNIFLLGDAANLRWPRGGFGMNTGIGDVGNLGWKLEALIKGWGGGLLLDSYEAERRPIALATVSEAAASYRSEAELVAPPEIEDDSAAGEAARQRLGELIRATRSREWSTLGVQLGQVLESSPVICNESGPLPPFRADTYTPTTRPGARAPHFWLSDTLSVLDRFGRGYCLVHSGDDSEISTLQRLADRAGVPMSSVQISDPDQAGLYERRFVLVRPDGHVCWRGNVLPEDLQGLLRAVTGRDRDECPATSEHQSRV
jgi:2-polyprenyl-6-methoxyphenol hydroxylase-like FAD-dependent oxidoreductase